MAFLKKIGNRIRKQIDAPAMPQAQVMPQAPQPFQMPQGIAGLNTQNQFTLPSGQTIDLAQIQANLAGLNIPGFAGIPNIPAQGFPQPVAPMPSPVATPATMFGSLEATAPTQPTDLQSAVIGATPPLPVAAPAFTGYNDGNNAVSGDFNPYERVTGVTNPVYTPPPLPVAAPMPSPVAAPMPSPVAAPAPAPLGMPTAMAMAPPTPMPSPVAAPMPPPVAAPAPASMLGSLEATAPQNIPNAFLPTAQLPNPAGTVGATTPPVGAPMPAPLTPNTGAGQTVSPNYIPEVTRNETGMDAATQQLLFGLDGQGGFIPGAMQASEKTFFNADGTPRVVEEQRAGFSGDQTAGMDLTRGNVGAQNPFLLDAQSAFGQGVSDIGQGIERGRGFQQQGLGAIQRGIGNLTGELGESQDLLRRSTGAYDQSMTDQFYNPYEDKVVQQTIDDVLESGDKQDMAARARDIQTGGESAFGSRARLGATDRREALGRGLGEALSGIRSRGFSEAQQTGMGEFARRNQAQRAASQGLAGLAGTRFGAAQAGAGALSNMGGLESQYGQNLANAQFGLGSNLQGLGSQTQQAGAFDASQLMGQGGLQQQQAQAVLDAQRANALTAQAAPLAQYQALSPFVNMAPKGSFQTSTRFTPRPSAMMAGINTGLGAFGAFGSMARGTRAT